MLNRIALEDPCSSVVHVDRVIGDKMKLLPRHLENGRL